MIENAYNLENYFFVREQKKKTNKNKTKQERKWRKNSVIHMPLHCLLTSLIRYFLDTVMVKLSKEF